MFFGQRLRELRLEYAKMGVRRFAKKIKMSTLEYYNIEHGYEEPPKESKWITLIIENLGLEKHREQEMSLLDLWTKPFVMQKKPEDVAVSPLAHKTDGTRLTKEEYISLNKHINDIAKEHNKKADRYNKLKK